jgi:hypothetical protein
MFRKALDDEHGDVLQMNRESLPPKRRTVIATSVELAAETHTQGLLSNGLGSGFGRGPLTIRMPIDNAIVAN